MEYVRLLLTKNPTLNQTLRGEGKNLSRETHHAFPSTSSLPIETKLDQIPFRIKDRIRFLSSYKISCSVWEGFCMVAMCTCCVRVHNQAIHFEHNRG